MSPHFAFLTTDSLEGVGTQEWDMLQAQRHEFHRKFAADQLLVMLEAGKNLPTYGYRLNNYEHCLQTATMMADAGYEGEDLVVGLLHDVAFVTSPNSHGAVAGLMLGDAISERNQWMLKHHAIVGERLLPRDSGRWRALEAHPYYAWTEEFVERFDLRAIDPSRPTAPIEAFAAAVRELVNGVWEKHVSTRATTQSSRLQSHDN